MKHIFLGMGAVATALVLGAPVTFADQINAQSSIVSATVFPAGAEVTRSVKVTLNKGKHTVLLKDLPSGMVANSVIIDVAAGSGVKLEAIDTQYVPIAEDQQEATTEYQALEEQIKKLTDEKSLLELDLRTASTQQAYIQKLTAIPEAKTGQTQPDWTSIFALISEKTTEINKKIFETRKKVNELNKALSLLKHKIGQMSPKQKFRYQLKAQIIADRDISTDLKLRYQIISSKAGWQQQYEAHLDTAEGIEKAELKIIRRASIHQASGEDWSNIKLTLSTTIPTQGTSAPDLEALRLVLKRKGKFSSYSGPDRTQQQAPAGEFNFGGNNRSNVGGLFGRPRNGQTGQQHLSFHTLYHVPENVTLIANGNEKQIPMGNFTVKPSLRAITVPRIKKLAYLSTKFKMPKDMNSSRGVTYIYRDGTFVGTGTLPNLNAGAEYDLGFGVDNKIIVKHAEINRTKDSQHGILSSTNSDERHYKITVKNLHSWKMPVTIMDRYPFAHDKEIQIHLNPQTTKTSRNNVEDKRGVLAWDRDVKANSQEQIDLSYKITWPANKSIDIDRVYRNTDRRQRMKKRLKY